MPYANNKGEDKPAHHAVSALVVHFQDSIMPLLAIAEISRSLLVSSAEQTGLILTWSETPKICFLMTRLILCVDFLLSVGRVTATLEKLCVFEIPAVTGVITETFKPNCCMHLRTNSTVTSSVNSRKFSVVNNSDLD